MKLNIIGLQELGLKEYDTDNKMLKIKFREYETILMHCNKSTKRNEAETSVGIIFFKSLFPLYNINKYPDYRAITIFVQMNW